MKKIISIYICIMVVIGLTGCQIQKKNNENKSIDLIKSEVILPEDFVTVFSIEKKDENELYVVLGTDEGDSSVYILNIIDGSWTLYQDVKELLKNTEYSDYFVSVSKNGEIFICCSEDSNDILGKQKCFIANNNELKEITIDLQPLEKESAEEFAEALGLDVNAAKNVITSVLYENDRFYLVDVNGYLYGLDSNLYEVSMVYMCGQNIGDVRSIKQEGNELVVIYSDGVATFDINNARLIDGSMEKALASAISENPVNSSAYLDTDGTEGKLYLLCAGKVYAVSNGEIELRNKLQGLNANIYTLDFACCSDTTFFALSEDFTNSTRYLYCFSDKELKNTAETDNNKKSDDKLNNLSGEIRVWTLRENFEIDYLINAFTSKYPNVKINIEVGMTNEDGKTVSDAIKNLNAELLADDGPDVIFMDQINIEKYIDNGLLVDLSEVVTEIEKENNVFSNILRSFENEKGTYVVPSRFVLFGQTGNKEKVEASTDIQAWVNSLEEGNDKNIMDPYQVESVIQNLLYVSYEDWINDEGVDEGKVDEFVATVQKLCERTGKKKLNLGSEMSEPEITVNYYEVGNGTYELAYDYIISYGYQVQGMRAIAEGINGDYKIPASGFDGVFIPTELLGINSKSKHVDIAKELIKTQFDASVQSMPTGKGNAINMDSFKAEMLENEASVSERENGIKFEFKAFSDNDVQETNELICKLNKPIIRDGIMLDIVYETLAQCIEGKISKDEAVRNISEKVMLYISEQ